jgi:hypothetical protein
MAVGLCAFTLAYAEGFVRLFDPQPIMPRYVTGTSYGVRGNIPNAHYWHTTPEVEVEFRINSLGMRDTREFPYQKPPATCRIALFGDSFFMGYELKYDDTFAHRLEAQLRDHGVNAEVLNFAVSGFGTAEMIRTYEAMGSRFGPDVVIFQWHSTDPDDNVRARLFSLQEGRIAPTNATYLPSIATQDMLLKWKLYRLVADHSHLYSFIREGVAKIAKKMLVSLHGAGSVIDANASALEDEQTPASFTEGSKSISPGARLSAALLNYAKTTVTEAGNSFYVVEIPLKYSRTEFKSSIAVLPEKTLSQLKVISPLDSFRKLASPDRKLFFEQGQGHITPIAVNALVDVATSVLLSDPHFEACRMNGASASQRTAASKSKES